MFETVDYYIQKRIADNWAETDIDFDNVRYTPTIGEAFVRLQIHWAFSEIVSIGSRIRAEGYVDLSLFVPYGEGTRTAMGMADRLSNLYYLYRYEGLSFKAPTIDRVGQEKEWYQIKIIIPFVYDTCQTIGFDGFGTFGYGT